MSASLTATLLALLAAPPMNEDQAMSPSIYEVKKKYQDELMAKTGVVSVGIAKDADGTLAIIVGLDHERPDTVKTLPKELEGYPVRAQVIGTIKAQ